MRYVRKKIKGYASSYSKAYTFSSNYPWSNTQNAVDWSSSVAPGNSGWWSTYATVKVSASLVSDTEYYISGLTNWKTFLDQDFNDAYGTDNGAISTNFDCIPTDSIIQQIYFFSKTSLPPKGNEVAQFFRDTTRIGTNVSTGNTANFTLKDTDTSGQAVSETGWPFALDSSTGEIRGTSSTGIVYTLGKWSMSDIQAGLFKPKVLFTRKASITNGDNYWYPRGFALELTVDIPMYTIQDASVHGSIQGAGEYFSGKVATLTAIPDPGYEFVQWADGSKNITKQITVTQDSSQIAYFKPIYVTYDSIFNFQKWKDAGISPGLDSSISNISDTGFTMTITNSADPMTNTTPTIEVVAGQKYILEFDVDVPDAFQPFVFYCIDKNNNQSWQQAGGGGTHADGTPTYNQKRVEFTPTTNWISLRFDIDGSVGRSGHFSNFRIYPADFDYMSTTVAANERTDVASWSMPTPKRVGKKFVGWFTQPNGGGTKYTSSSQFPTTDLTLYSHWEEGIYTIVFKDQNETVIQSNTVQYNTVLDMPTLSRKGYTFVGWIPCQPAKTMSGMTLDSQEYLGNNTSFATLSKDYKYTNNLAIHVEVYMDDWDDIKNDMQIISCTQGGGWGLGFLANTSGKGTEIHTGSYSGIDLGFANGSTNFSDKTWYTFDVVFSNGVFEAYINGVKKGSVTTSGTTINYNANNTIFVGAEAGDDTATPANGYFKGFISNVFIANQNKKLEVKTGKLAAEEDVTYYPVWRINTAPETIFIGNVPVKEIYVGTQLVKEVYIGTTKIYG